MNGWPAPLFVLALQATVMCFLPFIAKVPTCPNSNIRELWPELPNNAAQCKGALPSILFSCTINQSMLQVSEEEARNIRQLDNRKETTVKHL